MLNLTGQICWIVITFLKCWIDMCKVFEVLWKLSPSSNDHVLCLLLSSAHAPRFDVQSARLKSSIRMRTGFDQPIRLSLYTYWYNLQIRERQLNYYKFFGPFCLLPINTNGLLMPVNSIISRINQACVLHACIHMPVIVCAEYAVVTHCLLPSI